MNYLLYNPKSSHGRGEKIKNKALKKLNKVFPNLTPIDFTNIDYKEFSSKLFDDDNVIITGGDGTLNYFVNLNLKNNIKKKNCFMYGCGTGNDFFNDINKKNECIKICEYIKDVPTLYVNDKEYYYINNIGYGIDGETCYQADLSKKKKKNYRLIALKLLLSKFKPRHASVTVDGKKYEFDNVWIAAAMNGRYYGGGMMIAPNQVRNSGKLSLVIIHHKSRFRIITAFPTIFKGKHLKYKNIVETLEGKQISVKFDKPTSLQYDGETINNVSEYKTKI